MYEIKKKPEEFIVKEISNIKFKDKGDFVYFLLKKKEYNTLDAIKRIADALNAPVKWFGFAGNKDRKAITEQLVSAKGVKKENLERLKLRDIEIKIMGYGDRAISLGDLRGNEFIITIRGLDDKEFNCFNKNKQALMPNYFGEQRFSKVNVEVGRAIIKKDFKKVAGLLELDVKNNDFIGALRKIDKKILRLYIHAYQSYIWNEAVRELPKLNKKIPIIGFGTELDEYGDKINVIVGDILEKERLNLRDFVISQMPELSSEGDERDSMVEIKDLEVLEKGRDWVKIKFFLRKGSYATEAVKFLFS